MNRKKKNIFEILPRSDVEAKFNLERHETKQVIELRFRVNQFPHLQNVAAQLVETGDVDGTSLLFGLLAGTPASVEIEFERAIHEPINVSLFARIDTTRDSELSEFLDSLSLFLDGFDEPEVRFVGTIAGNGNYDLIAGESDEILCRAPGKAQLEALSLWLQRVVGKERLRSSRVVESTAKW